MNTKVYCILNMEPTAENWSHDLEDRVFGEIKKILPIGGRGSTKLDTIRGILSMMSSRSSDTGFIEFLWGDSYEGGRDPLTWRKSSEIFIQYMKNGRRPVKYGQCWVGAECLSALLQVTGMRARTLVLKNAIIDVGCNRGMDVLSGSKSRDVADEEGIHDEAVMDTVDMGCSDWNVCIVPKAGERQPPSPPTAFTSRKDSMKVLASVGRTYSAKAIPTDLKADTKWNFHYITQVCIEDEWLTMDCTPCLARHEQKPYYGPCKTSTIKNGGASRRDSSMVEDEGFEHLFSLINGVPRYWSSFSLGKDTIFFPHTVDFSIYNRDHPSNISVKTGKERRDVTNEFRHRDRASAINAYYARNPIIFGVSRGSLRIMEMRSVPSDTRLQVVVIGRDVSEILICKRMVTVNGDDNDQRGIEEFLSEISLRGATKISILLMNNQKMFIQVIDVKEKLVAPVTLPR